jgi:hypothetical protein
VQQDTAAQYLHPPVLPAVIRGLLPGRSYRLLRSSTVLNDGTPYGRRDRR